MKMTAVIQYILTAAKSSGSQDYTAKSRRHRLDGLSYVPKTILTWMLMEAWGGLIATSAG